MVKVSAFVFVLCITWVLFNEGHGSVQIYNRDGVEPRNISVNINGDNGGNICIDCQNQIQLGTGLGDEEDLAARGDWQRYLDPKFRIQSILFIHSPQFPTLSTMGSTPTTTSVSTTTTTTTSTTTEATTHILRTTHETTTQAPLLLGCIDDCP